MIIDVNEQTIIQIKNPELKTYAAQYLRIYGDFLEQVAHSGIEIDSNDYSAQAKEKVEQLRKRGAVVRNDDKSIYLNNISPSCIACQTGSESTTFFISLQCHRDCFYCFNPNQEDYSYNRGHTRDVIQELAQIKKSGQRVRHLALTGGEPLLFKDKAYEVFRYARDNFPGVYTRLYTSGDHADIQTLQALRDAGLQEIRFSIRMHDLEKGHDYIYDRIATAQEFIPFVMVEMPVLPGTLDTMKDVLIKLDQLGLFSINLLEFCFPYNNADIYKERGYKIKARPYRVLYNYWYAGGLPVSQSELVCLDLLGFALDEGLKLGVHYCSLENKHTGQVYQQNTGHKLPANAYFSRRDYFLKTAKVFGDDIEPVKKFFDKKGDRTFTINKEHNYLEFHVSKIRELARLDLEIGISLNIFENRNGELYVRELKLDMTTPQTFRLSDV